ncbi:MAG: polysaccharide deacetylase family protein, partial [Acidobacteriaceae bacterium]
MLALLATAGAAAGLAAGGYTWAALSPQSQIFGRTIVAGSDPAEFALTYDDGPNEAWTPQLLDLLAQRNVCATFFVIGKFVRQRPDLVRAVRTAGHLIGNHTVSHPWLTLESPRRVREELAGCNAAIEDAIGER